MPPVPSSQSWLALTCHPSFAAVAQTTAIFIGNTTGSTGLFFPNGTTNAIKGVPPLPGNYPAGVGVRAKLIDAVKFSHLHSKSSH